MFSRIWEKKIKLDIYYWEIVWSYQHVQNQQTKTDTWDFYFLFALNSVRYWSLAVHGWLSQRGVSQGAPLAAVVGTELLAKQPAGSLPTTTTTNTHLLYPFPYAENFHTSND